MIGHFVRVFSGRPWQVRPKRPSKALRKLKFRRGRHLRRVWVGKDIVPASGSELFIGLGDIDATAVADDRDEEKAIEAVRCGDALHDALGMPPWRELDGQRLSGRKYRMDLAIVELRPGMKIPIIEIPTGIRLIDWPQAALALAHFWIDHTWVQIEGALYDEDRRIFAFVERRRYAAEFTGSGIIRRTTVFFGASSTNTMPALSARSFKASRSISCASCSRS